MGGGKHSFKRGLLVSLAFFGRTVHCSSLVSHIDREKVGHGDYNGRARICGQGPAPRDSGIG